MIRFTDSTTEADVDRFVQSLPEQFFTHKDVMRCYSIFQRNEYEKSIRNTGGPRQSKRPWSEAEVGALTQGVMRYGEGHWLTILKAFPAVFAPANRTGADLERQWAAIGKSAGGRTHALLSSDD
jgi:hypothetical protein